MKLLVSGASGLLGLNLCLSASQSGAHAVTGVVHRNALPGAPFSVLTADLSQPGEAERALESVQPDALIHAAAMANLDDCENDPEGARRVNAQLPGRLAGLCARQGVRLIHISTDAVFDGLRGDYSESDPPQPRSVYSQTKLDGERAVLEANPDAAVARVNFYGWSLRGKRSLAEQFVTNLSAGQGMLGFTDVHFCPLQVNDLGEILLRMLDLRLSGLFHTVSSECLTKDEFGRRIARRFGLDESLIRPVLVREAGLRAARSPNLTLRTGRLAAALGQPLPGVQTGLERFHAEWSSGWREKVRGQGQEIFD